MRFQVTETKFQVRNIKTCTVKPAPQSTNFSFSYNRFTVWSDYVC